MKIVHTSDWHLGKKLYRTSRINEQRKFLNWLCEYLIDEKVDILLISGDIFDVPTPPNDALIIYFNFLKEITTRSDIQIFIISGNHDSSKFLMAPSPFLEQSNIHVCGNLDNLVDNGEDSYIKKVTIDGEEVAISMFPYFRTHEIFNLAKKWEIDIENGALPVIEELIKKLTPKGTQKNIIMAHHLFGSYEEAGSELGLTLSGVESIPTKLLKDFDYVALGHIHKSQTLSKTKPIIHYSGSPMAFRFSETTTKSLSLVEIKSNELSYELIEIEQFDKLLRVSCTKDELEQKLDEIISTWSKSDVEVYIEFKIKTDSPITGLAEQLRTNLAEHGIHLLSFQTIVMKDLEDKEEHFLEKTLTTEELFKMYYKKKFPEASEMPKELNKDFKALLEQVRDSNET
jgi:exonuclease SbcD